MKKLEWKVISKDQIKDLHGMLMNEDITLVAKAFKGWLVKHTYVSSTATSNQRTECMTFVPDNEHEWDFS